MHLTPEHRAARPFRWLALLALLAAATLIAPPGAAADDDSARGPAVLVDSDSAVRPAGVTVAPELGTPEAAVTSYERLRIEIDAQRIKHTAQHADALGWLVARRDLLDPAYKPGEREYVVPAYQQDDSTLRRLAATAQYATLLTGATYTIVPHRKLGATEALVLVRRLNRILQQDESGVYGVYDERQNVDVRVRRVGEAWRVVDEQPPEVVLPPRTSVVDTPALRLPPSAAANPPRLLPPPAAQPDQLVELAEDVTQAYLAYTREFVRMSAPTAEELQFERQQAEYQLLWLAPLTEADETSAPGGGPTVSWLVRMQHPDLIAWLSARIAHREALAAFAYPPVPGADDTYEGRLDEFRFSSTVRYREAFTPAERFKVDTSTICLFHLDEGEEGPARDATAGRFRADWIVGKDERGRPLRAPNVVWTRDARTGRIALTCYPSRRTGIELEEDIALKPREEFTIEAWIYPFSPGEGRAQTLVAQWGDWSTRSAARNTGFRLWITADGQLVFEVGNGSRSLSIRSETKVERQRWQHVAATFKIRQLIGLFLDGEPVAGGKLADVSLPDHTDALDADDPLERIAPSPRPMHLACTSLPPWPPELVEDRYYYYKIPIDASYLDLAEPDEDRGDEGNNQPPSYQLYHLRDIDDGDYAVASFALAVTPSGMRVQIARLPTLGE